MKPRNQGGVVDPRLNVYGTQNLKVAGMSLLCFYWWHIVNVASRLQHNPS